MSRSRTDVGSWPAFFPIKGGEYDVYHFPHRSVCEAVVDAIEGLERDVGTLLDIGCGTGNETLLLGDMLDAGYVVGVEPAASMVRRARAKKKGVWLRAVGEALPFPDGIADVVTCFFALHHFSDLSLALNEMRRVLRGGGQIALVTVSHDQLGQSLEYRFFSGLFAHDVERVPLLEDVLSLLKDLGFFVRTCEVEYERRPVDLRYYRMMASRYRSGLRQLTDLQLTQGLAKIREVIGRGGADDEDVIHCTVVHGNLLETPSGK